MVSTVVNVVGDRQGKALLCRSDILGGCSVPMEEVGQDSRACRARSRASGVWGWWWTFEGDFSHYFRNLRDCERPSPLYSGDGYKPWWF
jgi:hypothetical protein